MTAAGGAALAGPAHHRRPSWRRSAWCPDVRRGRDDGHDLGRVVGPARPAPGRRAARQHPALLVGTVALTLLIGVSACAVVVRTDLPWKPLWHAVLAAPLAVPAFVNSYGWVSMTHDVAVVRRGGAGGVAVLLPVRLSAGGRRARGSRRRTGGGRLVVGALTAPDAVQRGASSAAAAVLGGALLVALHVLAEFGALQMLALPDVHDRDLRPVPLRVRQRWRHRARRCARGPLPAAAGRGDAAARPAPALALGQGHRSTAEPVRLGRARLPVDRRAPVFRRGRPGGAARGAGPLDRGRVVDGVPHRRARPRARQHSGPGRDGRSGDDGDRAGPGWLAVRTRGPLGTFLERARTSRTPCPASWWRWPSSTSRSG